jgi:L-2-hydroxyglutarate oxidase LhgO
VNGKKMVINALARLFLFWQVTWGSDDKEKGRTFFIKKGHGIDIFLIFAGEKEKALRERFRQLRCHGLLARTGSLHLHGLLALAMQVPTQPQAEKGKQGAKASRKLNGCWVV